MPPRLRSESSPPSLATPEDEYGLVDLGGGLYLVSLSLFLAALGSRFVVEWLPVELRPFPKPALSALAVPLFSGLGLLAGLLGLRGARGRELARLGVFLNGAALTVGVLVLAALYFLLR